MLRVFLVIDDYNELIYLQSLLKKLGLDVEGVQNQKKYADMSLGFNPHILIATAKGNKVDGLQLTKSLYRKRGLPKVLLLKSPEQNNDIPLYRDAGVDDVLDSPVNPRKLILAIANLGGVDETALLEKYAKIKTQLNEPGDMQGYAGSYDENGQAVENVHRIRQNIDAAVDANGVRINNANGATDGLSDSKTGAPTARFPLRPANAVAPTDAEARSENYNENYSEDESEEATLEPKSERSAHYEEWTQKMGPLEPRHFVRDRILDFNKKIRSIVPEDIDKIEDERKKFVKALFKNAKNK